MSKVFHKPIARAPIADRTYNCVVYDSKAEAKRAAELDMLKRAGRVAWWLRQVPIDVGEAGVDKPYRVDFLVYGTIGRRHWDLTIWAEDVTGFMTASKRRHIRQWRKRGPFPLHILTKTGTEIVEPETP